MKGELKMEFVDVVDVKQGLAMFRLKKKITFENKFFSSSEWEKKRKNLLNNQGIA